MDINGVYKGFSPTDESDVRFGEIEFTISDESVTYRFATGLEIWKDKLSRKQLREMTRQEIIDCFEESQNVAGINGYTFGEECMTFLFMPGADYPNDASILVLRFASDDIDAIFGPTVLFTPENVANGSFDRAITAIEEALGCPGGMPRIANGGTCG